MCRDANETTSSILLLRFGADGAVTVDHRTAGQAPVVRLSLQQVLFLRSAAIGRVDAVFYGNEASTTLPTASAVPKLSTECIQVNLSVQQGFSDVSVAVNFDKGAAVFLHHLDRVGLRLLCGAEGGRRSPRSEDCNRCVARLLRTASGY